MSISTSDDANPCSSSSDTLHQAICNVVDAGVVFALSAGNDNRLKNAYPEALTVSAIADFDGKAGGLGSSTCRQDQDDTLADFSNFGPEVDIAAPGTCILSTWNDGGLNTISGTSMASPHAAGAVALYLHVNNLSPATNGAGVDAIEQALLDAALPQNHECGYNNEYAGQGSDEPLLFVNGPAFGGNGSCGGSDASPTVSISSPADGATVSGTTAITADASDDNGVSQVEFFIDGNSVGVDTNGGDGWSIAWDTTTASNSSHTLTATATDAVGNAATSPSVTVTVDNGASTMHVGDLDGTSASQLFFWNATVTITVHDANEGPVNGATVSGAWSTGLGGTTSCTTNSNGQCSVTRAIIFNQQSGVTFSVGNVTHSTLTYQSSDNHDPDADSNGTNITISKP